MCTVIRRCEICNYYIVFLSSTENVGRHFDFFFLKFIAEKNLIIGSASVLFNFSYYNRAFTIQQMLYNRCFFLRQKIASISLSKLKRWICTVSTSVMHTCFQLDASFGGNIQHTAYVFIWANKNFNFTKLRC